MRFHPKDLERAFFSERRMRMLDGSGYVTLMRWRLYGEEGLAGKEADLWLLERMLTVEHAGASRSRPTRSSTTLGPLAAETGAASCFRWASQPCSRPPTCRVR